MATQCFIECCNNTNNQDDIFFFPFPENELLNILWSQAIQRHNCKKEQHFICSKHFKEEDFIYSNATDNVNQIKRLSEDAVPSLFLLARTKTKMKPETRHYHHHHQVSSSSSDSDEYIARNAPTKEKLKRKIKLLKQKIYRFESKFENIKIQLKEELTKRNLTETDAQSAMTLLTRKEFAYKFKPHNNSIAEKNPSKKLSITKSRRSTSNSSSNVEMSSDESDNEAAKKEKKSSIELCIKSKDTIEEFKLFEKADVDVTKKKDSIQLQHQNQPSTSARHPDYNIEILQLKSLQPSNNLLLDDVISSEKLFNETEKIFITTPVSNFCINNNKLVLLNTTNIVKDEMEL